MNFWHFAVRNENSLIRILEKDTISFQEGLKLLQDVVQRNDGVLSRKIYSDNRSTNTIFTPTTHMALGTTQHGENATESKITKNTSLIPNYGKTEKVVNRYILK